VNASNQGGIMTVAKFGQISAWAGNKIAREGGIGA
jgi:hypothetical protein